MKKYIIVFLFTITTAYAWAQSRLDFPENYKSGVLYTTVQRGNVIEDMYVDRAVVQAVKNGQPIPNGAIITMEEYRRQGNSRGDMNRYIIMEKINNDWKFEAFLPDKTVNTNENPQRYYNCHAGVRDNDFVFTLQQMKQSN